VNVDRLQALGYGSGREILPFTLPPARSMNAAISSPAYCRPTVGSWVRLMRLRPWEPRARNWLIASGVIGVCFSAEWTVLPLRAAWIVLKFTASAEFSAS
jgi:hypothetical protein